MCLWRGGGSYVVAAAEGFTEGREESEKPRWLQGDAPLLAFSQAPPISASALPDRFKVTFQSQTDLFFCSDVVYVPNMTHHACFCASEPD